MPFIAIAIFLSEAREEKSSPRTKANYSANISLFGEIARGAATETTTEQSENCLLSPLPLIRQLSNAESSQPAILSNPLCSLITKFDYRLSSRFLLPRSSRQLFFVLAVHYPRFNKRTFHASHPLMEFFIPPEPVVHRHFDFFSPSRLKMPARISPSTASLRHHYKLRFHAAETCISWK